MKKSKKQPTLSRKYAFRVTEAEMEVIKQNAKGARMSVSEYIRKVLSGRTPAYRVEIPVKDPEILKIFSNLDTVSQDLNRIAARLNAGDKWDNDLHSRVKDDLQEIYRMKEEFREYSSGETLKDKVLTELNKLNLNDHGS